MRNETRPAPVLARSACVKPDSLLLAGRVRGVAARVRGAGALNAIGLGFAILERSEGAVLRAVLRGHAELAGAGHAGLGRLRALRGLGVGERHAGDERRSGGESGQGFHLSRLLERWAFPP